jgi:osmotically inducible protein OsmC
VNDAPPAGASLFFPGPVFRPVQADEKESQTMKRSASAVWKGGLKDGTGTVSTESAVLSNVPYNFRMRFENEKGTNPEELIAAAHAACFSMALSMILGDAGMKAESINTTATVTLEQAGGGFSVTSSALDTKVKIPNADKAAFQKAAEAAKTGCPISKLLNAKITMNATLV